jgi:preprotein translocase subunit YajC
VLTSLLPLLLLVVVMVLMTRSAKKKQAAAAQMRNSMQPGTGVRTIGGMYGTVKSVTDDAVLLEIAPGMDVAFGKNAIGAVLDDAEYARIVDGAMGLEITEDDELPEGVEVPEDASALDAYHDGDDKDGAEGAKLDLSKSDDDEPHEQPVQKADLTKAEDRDDERSSTEK